jgi:hypothetical protein
VTLQLLKGVLLRCIAVTASISTAGDEDSMMPPRLLLDK